MARHRRPRKHTYVPPPRPSKCPLGGRVSTKCALVNQSSSFFSTFWLRRLTFHFKFFDNLSFSFCASSACFIVAMASSFCFSNKSLNSLCFEVASSICFSYEAASSFTFAASHAANSSMKVFSFLLQCSRVDTTHGSLELSLTNFLSLLYSRGPSYFSPSSPVSLLKYLIVGYPL